MLFAIVLLGAVAGLFPPSLATSPTDSSPKDCFCTSDQPCWPSPEDFSELESQVSQPLVYPVPTAYPCYPPDHPSGNCTEVTANWTNDLFLTGFPGSMMAHNLEAYVFRNGTFDICHLDPTITGVCGQGSVSVIGVDARSVADVQTAVNFAAKHRLKLVVKNIGHDYIGRSNAKGSFVVWTYNMKSIIYNDEFTPEGALGDETFKALTLGAGVQWLDAITAANNYDRLVVSGGFASVGSSGGWLQGGGHSALSPSYGLGVDNTLEIGIVLSSGDYLITNKYQNEDLFWALLGGGGGTYGIVTSVTYRTYPMVAVQKWTYAANASDSSEQVKLMEGYLRYQPQFTNAGWGGFGLTTSNGISFTYWAPAMSNDTAIASSQAWQNYVASLALPGGVVSVSETTFYSSWFDTFGPYVVEGESQAPALDGLVSSRLLTADVIEANGTAIAELVIDCGAGINTIAGGKVSEFGADSVGLNPAWRTAIVHPLCYGFAWSDNATPAEVESVLERVKSWTKNMHDLTPGIGTYLNEASPYEIDWQYSFFGDHYDKLKSIKDKYDTEKLFVVQLGVGSDEWDSTLTCRL